MADSTNPVYAGLGNTTSTDAFAPTASGAMDPRLIAALYGLGQGFASQAGPSSVPITNQMGLSAALQGAASGVGQQQAAALQQQQLQQQMLKSQADTQVSQIAAARAARSYNLGNQFLNGGGMPGGSMMPIAGGGSAAGVGGGPIASAGGGGGADSAPAVSPSSGSSSGGGTVGKSDVVNAIGQSNDPAKLEMLAQQAFMIGGEDFTHVAEMARDKAKDIRAATLKDGTSLDANGQPQITPQAQTMMNTRSGSTRAGELQQNVIPVMGPNGPMIGGVTAQPGSLMGTQQRAQATATGTNQGDMPFVGPKAQATAYGTALGSAGIAPPPMGSAPPVASPPMPPMGGGSPIPIVAPGAPPVAPPLGAGNALPPGAPMMPPGAGGPPMPPTAAGGPPMAVPGPGGPPTPPAVAGGPPILPQGGGVAPIAAAPPQGQITPAMLAQAQRMQMEAKAPVALTAMYDQTNPLLPPTIVDTAHAQSVDGVHPGYAQAGPNLIPASALTEMQKGQQSTASTAMAAIPPEQTELQTHLQKLATTKAILANEATQPGYIQNHLQDVKSALSSVGLLSPDQANQTNNAATLQSLATQNVFDQKTIEKISKLTNMDLNLFEKQVPSLVNNKPAYQTMLALDQHATQYRQGQLNYVEQNLPTSGKSAAQLSTDYQNQNPFLTTNDKAGIANMLQPNKATAPTFSSSAEIGPWLSTYGWTLGGNTAALDAVQRQNKTLQFNGK